MRGQREALKFFSSQTHCPFQYFPTESNEPQKSHDCGLLRPQQRGGLNSPLSLVLRSLSSCQQNRVRPGIRLIQGYLNFFNDYFLKSFRDILGMSVHQFQYSCKFLAYMSVCQFAQSPTEITAIKEYIQLWIEYISEILKYSSDFSTPLPINLEFLSCLTVCQLTSPLMKLGQYVERYTYR